MKSKNSKHLTHLKSAGEKKRIEDNAGAIIAVAKLEEYMVNHKVSNQNQNKHQRRPETSPLLLSTP